MSTKPSHDDDVNENAARIVRATAMRHDEVALPRDVKAAWAAWIGHVQNVDERTKALLRAAFEAGYSARR
ncbi:MAG: hypothetical protein IPH13_11895 [Planctomycetes bacterium]|nr:hypothetical protein [Planctomycetota bacterium]